MKRTPYALGCLLAIGAAAQLYSADNSSFPRRQETIELAAQLLAPQKDPTAHLPANLVNPFNPQARMDEKAKGAKSPLGSDREILEKIAAEIRPSGMMVLGDRPLLIFQEKKYQVGDTLKRSFEGVDYTVEITAIESSTFRIRLNH
jgi:hypothetical protein